MKIEIWQSILVPLIVMVVTQIVLFRNAERDRTNQRLLSWTEQTRNLLTEFGVIAAKFHQAGENSKSDFNEQPQNHLDRPVDVYPETELGKLMAPLEEAYIKVRLSAPDEMQEVTRALYERARDSFVGWNGDNEAFEDLLDRYRDKLGDTLSRKHFNRF